MFRFLKFASFGLIATCGVSIASAGSITYNFVNYPSVQSGYTVNGSITTDGKIGAITTSDITAWSYTLSNGGTTYGTVTNATDQSGVSMQGEVDASATQITISTPPSVTFDANFGNPNQNELQFAVNGGVWTNNNGTEIFWQRNGAVTDSNPSNAQAAQDVYGASMVDGIFAYNPGGTFSLGGDPWVIATAPAVPPAVPEPASVVSGLIGVVGAMLAFRRRRTAA